MCLLCKKEQEDPHLSEDEARTLSRKRHTMPWFKPDAEPPDVLLDPRGYRRFLDNSARYDNTPDPPRHPSLRAIRQHWGRSETDFDNEASEDYCAPCAELYKSPDFKEIWWRDALERVEARLDPRSGVYEDPELRDFYERKRERLLKRLSGEEKKPAKKTEPMTMLPSVRVPDRVLDGLRERAAEEGVTFSDLVRRALDEWMML